MATTATTYPDEFVECRTLAHAWRYTTVTRDGKDFIQGRQCLRCDTLKYVTISSKGEILGSRYVYPRGYMVDGGGMTAEDRAGLRLRTLGINPARAKTRQPRKLRAVS